VARFVIDLVAAGAGFVVAVSLRREPAVLRRISGFALLGFAATLIFLGLTGWPIFRARIRHVPMPGLNLDALTELHAATGHLSVAAMSFFVPILIAAAFYRKGAVRRAVHVVVAFIISLLWLGADMTGYMLPRHLPDSDSDVILRTTLRFVVLHMLVLPFVLIALTLFIAWRHLRRTSLFPNQRISP
jgi:hypothetical protein